MVNFNGTYDCKVDAKGRIMFPAAFRKKMGDREAYRFVIKKDLYVKCLELYVLEEWERLNENINKKNMYFNREYRQLLRDFRMDATEVECDPTGRLLIPGRLLKQADIANDTVLSGHWGKVEIWTPELYYNSGGDEETKQNRFESLMGDVVI